MLLLAGIPAVVLLLWDVEVLLVTAPQSPLNSFADIIKAGKAPNSKVSYGACGAGTPGHLAAESLNIQYSMNILHIPYKGCGPTLVDVMGGQVDLAWVTLGAAAAPVGEGAALDVR